mmetsp:Transcript_27488/g.72410  ORF Transcript_27488/g.72410 Transcript_27488/m.72410 type:complete len:206 (-) Transcript_27488:606-1223(-)
MNTFFLALPTAKQLLPRTPKAPICPVPSYYRARTVLLCSASPLNLQSGLSAWLRHQALAPATRTFSDELAARLAVATIPFAWKPEQPACNVDRSTIHQGLLRRKTHLVAPPASTRNQEDGQEETKGATKRAGTSLLQPRMYCNAPLSEAGLGRCRTQWRHLWHELSARDRHHRQASAKISHAADLRATNPTKWRCIPVHPAVRNL